jgi:fido (protein-threonine AMPylation protein)
MAEAAPDEGAFSFLPRLSRDDLRNQIRGWEFLTTRYLMRARRAPADWSGPFLINIHRDVFGKHFPELAGQYRLGEAHYGDKAGPAPEKIDALLQQIVLQIQSHLAQTTAERDLERRAELAFLYAAQDHAELVRIHPFVDGNGRWARIATTAFLFDCGFPLGAIVRNVDKRQYIDALNRAIDNAEPGDLANHLLRGYLHAIKRRT